MAEMDGSSSVFDDDAELFRRPTSPEQLSRSNTDIGCDTPVCSAIDDSRTSDASVFSEFNNEQRGADESLPVGKPISRIFGPDSPAFAKLSRQKHIDAVNSKSASELEIIKEKFAKLLLGEDMSGGGKGVCAAVAVSNAITNLYATVFTHLYKLEPLPTEKRSMWGREMDCLLSVCDHIVEFYPSSQTLPDGTVIDLMATRPRSDISINLPALEKLDAMLLEELECFQKTEFWYVEEDQQADASSRSFHKVVERNDDKWWLPIPCVPACGLSERARKELQLKRECTNQIHKAAMAINSSILAEMDVPESYIAALPKSARGSVGDLIYRYMSAAADQFSPDYLLDRIDISSEHDALEIADRLEASMFIWQRRTSSHVSKSSWEVVKDLMGEEHKNEMLASRAENLLFCLKQRYRGLSQTTLDSSKIEYNKDVGQAILESYSRVLESLAFRIVALIDDVLFVDASVKRRLESTQKSS